MSKIDDIVSGLNELVSRVHTNTVGVVKSVNESEGTCAVELEQDIVLSKIRLYAVVSEVAAPFLLVPKVDSYVGITFVEKSDTEAYISMYTEIDKIRMRSGEFGGLVKIAQLETKLNKLVTEVNNLIQVFNLHTHPVPSLGTSSTTLTLASNATNFNKSDFENTLITHG